MLRLLLPAALAILSSLAYASAGSEPPRLLGASVEATQDANAAGAVASTGGNVAGTPIVRSRIARASTSLIAGLAVDKREGHETRFILDLFDGLELVAQVVAVDTTAQGGLSIEAEIEAVPGGRAILVQNGDVIAGSVSYPGESYSITTTPAGLQRIAQVDTSRLPVELPPRTPPARQGQPDVAMAPDAPVDSGRLIDLMVIYTPLARTQAGGTAQIQSRVALGVAETNAAYRNSGVAQRLRLVHVQELPYVESIDLGIDLDRITSNSIPSVHTLRSTHGADLVKLVVAANEYGCGIAWGLPSISSGYAAYGYSVTTHDCISPNYTFAHELGHNMGAQHEPGNSLPAGPRPYNRGYTPGYGWRDLMTYAGACGNCGRLLAFSNPRLTWAGTPAGPMGTKELHNIAHVLNLSAKTIANYRPTNTTLHPVPQRFNDVPPGHALYGHIEFLAQSQITSGCAPGDYCPHQPVTRRQMAVFLERALRASNWVPPAASGVFGDVPPASQFASFVEALWEDEVTLGCAPGTYCPEHSVTREQMALFMLRARCGADYDPLPPTAAATFTDVPASHPSFAQIEKLVAMGITTGCATGPARYCPAEPVTRAQMAAFIERAYPFVYGLAPVEACTP